MTTVIEDEFLTTEELASILKVSPLTVRDWRKKSIGPRAVKVGHAVRYARTDVAVWINQTNGVLH